MHEQTNNIIPSDKFIKDLPFICRLPDWQLEHCLLFSLGISAGEENEFSGNYGHGSRNLKLKAEYEKRLYIIDGCVRNNILNLKRGTYNTPHRINPFDFINLLDDMNLFYPPILKEGLEKYGKKAKNWKKEADDLLQKLKEHEENKNVTRDIEKPLHESERKSLLKMIAVLLRIAFGRSINGGIPQVKASELLQECKKDEVEIDEDTIRKHIKSALLYLNYLEPNK